ncbi:adenylyltransferase/cytidyltransferase family protein [Photobacterium profundum]|nr:adenylyltransferase/cytidyltransferase family protein [Photobacterium profundum]
MKIIITYGTFDLFHVGHVRLLKRLKSLGDKLIVGVSTDEFNARKGKVAFYNYHDRAEIVSSCQYVDKVIPEEGWEQKVSDIKEYGVSVFAIGDDWEGKFDELKDCCNVVYLKRTENISSSLIKSTLSSFGS